MNGSGPFLARFALVAAALIQAGAPARAETAAPPARPPFAQSGHPAAPDYAQAGSWAALPEAQDAADFVPRGASPGDGQAEAGVDVFYIHPTTDLSAAHWNGAVDDPQLAGWTDASVIARQAATFNAAGKVYAPRYRQGASGASDPNNPDAVAAFALAYADVKRAFAYYLAHYNAGRPFILVGHSQGAAHLNRLLAEEIDGKPVQRQMVAAYSLGVPQVIGAVRAKMPHIPICESAEQTGCLVSWNAALRGSDLTAYRAGTRAMAHRQVPDLEDERLLCVNPLTFRADDMAAPAEANPGSLPGQPGPLLLPELIAGATGAQCVDGIVMVDADTPARLGLKPLPSGSMHYHEVSLFYESVRKNARDRAQAFLQLAR